MPLSPRHYVHLRNGRFSDATETQAADVERLLDTWFADPTPNGLLLNFHGGLVSREKGKQAAELLVPRYQEAGVHPVFYVWESGPWEIVRNNLADISREPIFRRLLARVIELALGQVGAALGAKAPAGAAVVDGAEVREKVEAWEDGEAREGRLAPYDEIDLPPAAPANQGIDQEIEPQVSEMRIAGALAADFQLRAELERISNGLLPPGEVRVRDRSGTVQGSATTLMTPEGLEKLVDRPVPGERGLLSMAKLAAAVTRIVYRVVRRMINGRGHGLYTTSVEEILRELYVGNVGKGFFWDQMKKDTLDAFGEDPRVFGGTAFLDGLGRRLAAGASAPKITLVGHSTGAIYISHLLRKAHQILPEGVQFDVIFLAAALSFRHFDQTLQEAPGRIRHLRSFGMQDWLEKMDGIVPVIYPRSLLYFVSGLLEDEPDLPLIGMERFHDGRPPFTGERFAEIERCRAFLQQVAHRPVWSEVDGGEGLRCAARKHGEFDDEDPQTLESVLWLLRQGF